MYCPQCGAVVPEGAKFCPSCGVRITETSPVPPPNTSAQPAQAAQPQVVIQQAPAQQTVVEPKKKSRFMKILMWLGIFIVGVVALALFATSDLVDVADNHLAALRSGDIEQAYSYTSKRFRASTPLPAYKQFVASYPILAQHDEFAAGERSFEGNTGYVTGTLTSSQHGVGNVEFQMVKEGDVWRIQGFELN